MRIYSKVTLALVVAGFICLVTFGAGSTSVLAAEPKKVVVAKAGNFLVWGLLDLAIAKGLFANHGLEVEVQVAQGGPQVLAAVLAGRADFSTSTMSELLEANSQGQLVKIASPLLMQSQVACAVREDIASTFPPPTAPWTERVQALRGKRVGVTSVGGGVSSTLNYMLKGAGMTDRDVMQTAIGADPMAWVASLKNKQIDAMCAGIPIPQAAIAQGVARLYVSPSTGEIPMFTEMPDGIIAVAQATIDRDPEKVRAFVAGLSDAMKLMRADPQQAAAVIKKAAFPSLDQQTFDLSFRDIYKAFPATSSITEAQFSRALQYVAFVKGKPMNWKVGDLYESRFAPTGQ